MFMLTHTPQSETPHALLFIAIALTRSQVTCVTNTTVYVVGKLDHIQRLCTPDPLPFRPLPSHTNSESTNLQQAE